MVALLALEQRINFATETQDVAAHNVDFLLAMLRSKTYDDYLGHFTVQEIPLSDVASFSGAPRRNMVS